MSERMLWSQTVSYPKIWIMRPTTIRPPTSNTTAHKNVFSVVSRRPAHSSQSVRGLEYVLRAGYALVPSGPPSSSCVVNNPCSPE